MNDEHLDSNEAEEILRDLERIDFVASTDNASEEKLAELQAAALQRLRNADPREQARVIFRLATLPTAPGSTSEKDQVKTARPSEKSL